MNASNQTRIRPTPYLNLCSQPTSGARCPKSSLTPGRKHHKLLKDGSGVEVWPESIERIFVDGLQAYASCAISHNNHPSTFSEAGASSRSRLRNAYLVQYLASHGIDRSRKQVASHLQVLKNMWKAEGNSDILIFYHLQSSIV
ncbi:hypothetical protein BDP27DRAFT_683987 [Rhodocollybia butyracea]|uniref:TEA domain-containing protein n=1 Tax=Rhodocollybia butyracea TaxID=206335 RepID=A0A9P5PUP6_9AGAR|nr:hypothetical protein BDP27DRAFT_683987 [Rhodocollybia butyracea]